jgi:threonyl-tRNA synthetase
MPITDRTNQYCLDIAEKLREKGFRVETDMRNEKIGYKIREAQMKKIPYMVVVGDKEAENGTIAVRTRSGGDQGTMTLDAFLDKIIVERDTRAY